MQNISAFQGCLQAYQDAKADLDVRTEWLSGRDCDAKWERLDSRMFDAMVRLIETPSPDIAALSEKLALLKAPFLMGGWPYAQTAIAALAADARRLSNLH